jgi:hypothetical protein
VPALQSYLVTTLRSMFDNMSENEMSDCLVVIFIGETDFDDVTAIADEANLIL